MSKILEQITYDGSLESKNRIIWVASKANLSAYISKKGIVLGEKDEKLIKKGDTVTVYSDNKIKIKSHELHLRKR